MSITTDKKKTIKPTVIPDNIPLAEEIPLEEVPLEKVIENTLVKHNVTDAVIAGLKEKYSGMKLKSIDDKESYLDICDARKVVRKVGILTEQLCKKGREDAIREQKLWLSKQGEILGKVAEVQDPLDAEIKKFEDELERKELLEQKRKEEIYINRQAQLSKMGAVYDNGSFVLNHISYEIELLKSADDDMWNDTILPKYKKVYEELEAIKVEEENKRKAELEQQRKEREEFELKQKELFAQQQQQLQAQQDEANRKERLAQEQKEDEERKKVKEKIQNRADQLTSLGMRFSFSYDAYVFEDVNVDNKTEICLLDDKEWNDLVEKIKPVIEQRKQAIEEQRLAKIEEEKNAAIQKALENEKIKQQQEQQRKDDELAQANDKTKWQSFIQNLPNTNVLEMRSGIYKRKMQIAKEKIQEIYEL